MDKKTVVVLGEKYKIHKTDELDGTRIAGQCHYSPKKILISNQLDKQMSVETLLHEIVHAVVFESSVYQCLNGSVEEIICDNVAKVIARNFDLKFKK